MTDNKLNEVIQGALEKVKELSDTGTIIGQPIEMPGGSVIVPVSKVSLGFVSGGIDYLSKHSKPDTTKGDVMNFGGAGTTGLTVTPIGFLVGQPTGDVQFLPVAAAPGAPNNLIDSVTALLERSPAIVEKFKNLFSKKNSEAQETATEETDANAQPQETTAP